MPLFSDLEGHNLRAAQFAHFERLRDEVYGSYVSEVERDTEYYELNFANDLVPREWARAGTKAVKPPTAYNAVENAADHILTTPRVTVTRRPTTENFLVEEDIAARKRAFLRFMFQAIADEQGDPITQAKKKLVGAQGKSVIKFEVDWDNVPDDADDRVELGLNGLVYKATSISGETVFEDPDRPHDPFFVYEAYKTTHSAAMVTYPDAEGAWRTKEPHEELDVVEFWSKPFGNHKGEHVIWIDDEVVVETVNPYHWRKSESEAAEDVEDNPKSPDGPAGVVYDGWVPYIIRASGWGERKKNLDPEKLYVGILRRDRSMLDAEALHFTAASVQLMTATFPMILGFGIPEGLALEVGPGKVIRLPLGDVRQNNLVSFSLPDIQDGTWRIIDRAASYSNNLTKFDALGGQPLTGVDTATEADATVRNAAVKLSAPVKAVQSTMVEMGKRAFQMNEHIIEAPVTVFGVQGGADAAVTLDPLDIDGFYRIGVELQTSDQAALEARNLRTWTDFKAREPNLSSQTVMEKVGIENPTAEMEQAQEERIAFGPQMDQVALMLALTQLGSLATEVRTAFQQMLATGANQPGQAGPRTGDELSTEADPATAAVRNGQAEALVRAPERSSQ
jgi:hypothetical protein